MATENDQVIVSPFETEKDVEQGYHCISQAFGAQTRDGLWVMTNPGWDTPEGKALHTKRLLQRWQSVTTNKDGKPNTIFLKATLPDPDNQGERRVVGVAIWQQFSFVDGYGDPFDSDVSADLGSFSEQDRRFILQMTHSLWKRRIEYMREVEASGRNPPAIFTLDLCTVDPAYQRRGIAGKLVEAGLAEAKARGDLECTTEGSAMGRGLYRRLGFKDEEGKGEIHYELDDEFKTRNVPSNVFLRTRA
ncbi:hypothetical protein P3342_007004 [Pyrenophora teres f. teres]|uniref:Acetyltransf 7 multi-domain protein n=1 Tax=Pyrenophora teres f. teres TaxID=97479 RepID=A0A6S6W173_9PLEO|nr:hypothetical protein HRS9139_05523 [Pyrenophora teres f. teres]KAE8840525.1 hypothetical protein PTNB85_03924 [Pyrenophora teres f. teres]KAE8864024.1 hypothetical protein PTNB29_03988 [Pyrenophora teres f. teres]KAK1913760.1 hypothetical protein P3342_007004 [Pyrenophora teres f. teres]CAE7033129.1 Acetyltransf 7 multi-domain protein [Pyrenophora teres f. teres]